MELPDISDWDDAYANSVHIPDSEIWPEAWAVPARRFREESSCELDIAYGEGKRKVYDLFLPDSEPNGLFVFIHGGYWMALDKSYWSHLAQGALAHGWAVAMPSYELCPDVRISEIADMVHSAIVHAATRISGPIVISGHSAGGHLAASMISGRTFLPAEILKRVKHVVSISGLHDLRPLLNTKMNDQLQLTEAQAMECSPAFHTPAVNCKVTTWVGEMERPEFIRQSELLVNAWQGHDVSLRCVIHPGHHHFNVIDELAVSDSRLVNTCFGS